MPYFLILIHTGTCRLVATVFKAIVSSAKTRLEDEQLHRCTLELKYYKA